MNDAIKNVSSTYLFADDDNSGTGSKPADGILAVEFYPSYEDYSEIGRSIQSKYKLTSLTKLSLQAFVIVNTIVCPALLLFFDRPIAAILVFGLNVGFTAIFLPAISKTDYRRFYENLYPNLENDLVRVELSENGITCRCRGDMSFHAWSSITAVHQEPKTIFLMIHGSSGLAIRKSGFAYEEQARDFFAYLRGKLPSGAIVTPKLHDVSKDY